MITYYTNIKNLKSPSDMVSDILNILSLNEFMHNTLSMSAPMKIRLFHMIDY